MKGRTERIVENLKSLGWTITIIAFLVGIILLILFILEGTIWIGEKVFPFLLTITNTFTVISIFILIPMLFFKKTREWGAITLIFTSYLFGLTLWFYSALVAYILWGLIWLLIGLFLLGIGVLPIAFIASLISGEWIIVGNLIYMIVLTYGARMLGIYILERVEEDLNFPKNITFCEKCGEKLDKDSEYCIKCGNKCNIN